MSVAIAILFLLSFVGAGNAHAVGHHGDHLEVPGSPLSSMDFVVEYEYAVRKVLLEDRSEWVSAAMICLPPFDAEWAILVRRPKDGVATVEYVVADEQIWAAEARLEVAATVTTAEMPPTIASLLNRAWIRMLRGVRHPDSPVSFKDGTGYHFWAWRSPGGTMAGEISSPPRGRPAGQLVELAKRVRDYVIATDADRPRLLSAIKSRAEAVEER